MGRGAINWGKSMELGTGIMESVVIIELVQVIWVGPNSMATDSNPKLLCEGLAAYLTAASFA